MQGYGRSRVNEKGNEIEEVIDKPVERDCGLRYQERPSLRKLFSTLETRNVRGKGRLLAVTIAFTYWIVMEGNGPAFTLDVEVGGVLPRLDFETRKWRGQ